MKLMTYNIFDGGEGRLDIISNVINKEAPNVLVVNEANNFLVNNGGIAKSFSESIKMPFYEIAPTEWGYDVAIFSTLPFESSEILMSGKRAAVSVDIETSLGLLSIIGVHLNPGLEDLRLSEIRVMIEKQKSMKNRIIMGDLNSLSRDDNYSSEMIKDFNEKQIKKFTNNGKPRFEVIDELIMSGYKDTACLFNNKETTVPTPSNQDIAHNDLRLDYIFVSESLVNVLTSYRVVKNELTDKGSDHYPVVVTLEYYLFNH